MSDMTREEFLREKSNAEQRIRELYSGRTLPTYPDFVSIKENTEKQRTQGTVSPAPEQKKQVRSSSLGSTTPCNNSPTRLFKFLNIPEILKSPDSMLILGIILLLMSDNGDEMLILALIFIML